MNLSDVTSGTVERPPRIILCGTSKIGKSTFACDAPSPIVIPVRGEEGVDAFDVPKFPVCQTYDDVMSCIGALAEEDHDHKTVVIDSLTTLEALVWDAVCTENQAASIEKVGGGFGKGYTEAIKEWRDLMAGLDYLREHKGMGSILIAHVVVKSFSDPMSDSYDTFLMSINQKAATALEAWADVILFANSKTFTKTEKVGMKEVKKGVLRDERVMYTQKRPAHPGGGRGVYGRLDYELPFSFEAWTAAVAAARGEKK
jgi:hypothetical protein